MVDFSRFRRNFSRKVKSNNQVYRRCYHLSSGVLSITVCLERRKQMKKKEQEKHINWMASVGTNV